MRITNVGGSANTSGTFGVRFEADIKISDSLRAKLRGSTETAASRKLQRGLTLAGEYILKSTDEQFATEGVAKLGSKWAELSDRRLKEREKKLGGRVSIQRRGRRAFVSGRPLSRRDQIPILDDTHRLRKSVTRRGGENMWLMNAGSGGGVLKIRSNVRGAVNHHGDIFSNLPQRKFFFLTHRDKRIIRDILVAEAARR